MRRAYHTVATLARNEQLDQRTAAFVLAIKRVTHAAAARKAAWQEKLAQWKEKWGADQAGKMQSFREKFAAMQQQNPAFQSLRERLQELKAAKGSGDAGAWQAKVAEFKKHWQGLDPQARAQMQQNMPEMAGKLDQLANDPKAWSTKGNWTGPKGGQHQYDGTVTHQGNITTQDGTWKGPKGNETQVNGQWQRDGNTTTGHKTWTNQQGKQVTHDSVTTRDGKTANTTGSWTGANGHQVDVKGSTVVDGKTVTTTREYTGENGKQTDVTVTTTGDGKGNQDVDVTVTGPKGQSSSAHGDRQVSADAVKAQWTNDRGKTLTRDTQRSGEGGDGSSTTTWTGPDGQTTQTDSDWLLDAID